MMISRRTIRSMLVSWQNWRSHTTIVRAIPEIGELDRRQRDLCKSHRKGSAAIIAAKRQIMTEKLMNEVKHG